jgi:hypothetical protein
MSATDSAYLNTISTPTQLLMRTSLLLKHELMCTSTQLNKGKEKGGPKLTQSFGLAVVRRRDTQQ